MRATLIVNPNAGGTNAASSDELKALLEGAGLEPDHCDTRTEEDLDEALAAPGDVVVAAGGDGTLRAVATRLAGRGIPLVLVPLGTANNIGLALGVSGRPETYLPGLPNGRRHPFDLGVVRGPWGRDLFLEGAGLGLFASSLANYGPDDGKSPFRALSAALQTLREFEPREFRVWIDDELVEDHVVLLEAMNTPSIGPRLRFAPEALPGDGWLDVVMVNPDQQVGVTAYMAAIAQGQFTELQNVTHRRCKTLAIEWDGSPLHIDSEIRRGGEAGSRVEFEVWPGALEVWLPGPLEAESPASEPTPGALPTVR